MSAPVSTENGLRDAGLDFEMPPFRRMVARTELDASVDVQPTTRAGM